MSARSTTLSIVAVAAATGGAVLLWNGHITPKVGEPPFIATADAWIGHPATPLSYAGVARRTTRRTVVATDAYRYAPGYPPPAPYPYR